MKEDIDSKEIEQKIYRSRHQDGLLEILIGSFILVLGIKMHYVISYFACVGFMLLAPRFFRLKTLIIYPRMGYVRVFQEGETKERKKGSVLFIAFLLISILGLSIFLIVSGETGLSLELVKHVGENYRFILVVAVVCSMSVTAGLSGARYMYIYAALILIAVVGGHLFNIPRHLRLILPGAVMMLMGIVMLILFLHKYRIPAEETPMANPDKNNEDLQPIADIDRMIHEPARLMIIAHLYVVESADFLFLMRQTGLTRGNLSAHMSKLEAAGYVAVTKEFVEKIPRTLLWLTTKGKEAFESYRQSMKQVLDSLDSKDDTTE